jgi:D-serine deaminase-like pyridoxal phosphate-dependent protein
MTAYQTYKTAFAGRKMPFAYVDMDLFDQNITRIMARSGDKRVRIASKSVRCVALLRYLLKADSRIQGVMCYTTHEAVYLASQGFDDLLVAYPCFHPEDIRATFSAIRAGKTITLMVDCAEHVAQIQQLAHEAGLTVPVCLDIDLSVDFGRLHFGVWRSGVMDVDDALRVFAIIQKSPNVRLDGVMGYEAQIAGVGDVGMGIKSALIRWMKRRSIPKIAKRRADIVLALVGRGAVLRFVNGGGTGSLESTAQEACVTEVTAGSGFYSPALFDHYQGFKHLPAAGFALEIVRQPKMGTYTCLGGGYIASGGIDKVKAPLPYLPEGAMLTDLEGAGEVQTPIVYHGAEVLGLGDPVFLRHSKAGELCEHFMGLLLVRGGKVVDEVTTYRGDGMCFLG